ncbi:SusC/RagA family TonB-linked outer membrane protein [Sphingobacterium corticibacter]|uniref:TonB-dependent receptor n=1 Tax=Sphingobacterium corticibacter TaxID=2171749 RepID=A0A2T8HIE1_9SPHI|nr:TonB-dependent receptor [Sphingobacterium corticibacter]PVH25092.1 TonB-dependent receptor [Sphingobacterium corticibacter]
MRKSLLLSLLFLYSSLLVYGQTTIRGTVKDSQSQMSIPGATIRISGKSTISQTDDAGRFTIDATTGDALSFSFLGYETKTVTVTAGDTVLNVLLEDGNQTLEEIVVVGYGTQRQRNLTTAVATVRADDIVKTPAAQPMQALQGRVPGLQIVSNGAPGASPTVRLRGVTSAEGASAPLYVVDNMFFDNIDFLNPNDIATINVLKDASAAAIYGVRAANGVIIIETKSGAYNQEAEIVYDGYWGIQNPQNVLKMANTEQFVRYINETGSAADIAFIENAINRFGADPNNPALPNVNTNWYNEVMSPAPIQNHNLSFSGGSEKTRYAIGGSYFNQEGLLNDQRNDFTRLNFRTKVDSRVRDWLTVGGNFNVSTARQYEGENTAWFRSYFAVPTLPVFDPQNTAATPLGLSNAQSLGYRGVQNPFFPLNFVDTRNHIAKVLGNFNLEATIIENKLKFRTQYNYSLAFNNTRRVDQGYNDGVTQVPSAIRRNNTSSYDQVWDNFLTYDDQFGKHNLNAVLGHSYRSEYSELLFARGTAINPAPTRAAEQFWYLTNATDFDLNDIGDANETTLNANLKFLSFFGRVAYNYDGKYLLYGTLRSDGNNKFQKKWGHFATIGAGWVVSQEEFFNVPGIDFLKLRGGWGQLGNDGINPAAGRPRYQENTGAIGDGRVVGRFLNPLFDLISSWETTVETNVGIDAQFLNNRLSLNADYFIRDTRNLAVNIIPPVLRGSERRSVGAFRNTGFEMNLNWQDNINEDFSYSIGGNIATLKNEVRSLGDAPFLDAGQAEFRQRSIIGQPYQAFFGYDVTGVFQNEQQIQNSGYTQEFIQANGLRPGDLIFRDVNGDGVIDDLDRTVLGSYLPTFTWGGNIGLSYKRLDFSALFQGQSGFSILNRKRGEMIFTNDTNIDADLAENMWRGEGTSNQYPSASGLRRAWNQNMSSYFMESGSYFRLQNVRLSYTFFGSESKWPETRLTFTAERPLTIFKYNGFNPEVADGIDREVYPIPAVYTFGVMIKL